MKPVTERVDQFFVDGNRLEYTEYGSGERWVVLVHGQLMPRTMHEPLARKIAAAGNHVIALDLLGHGRSDKPTDARLFSMTAFAEQVVALLDERGIEKAVIGGTSLGANVSLEVAVLAPDRVQGLLLEMPVLDNAVEAGILAFAPLLFLSRFAPFTVHGLRIAAGIVPRRLLGHWGEVVVDTMSQQPRSMAAVIHGLFFGRVAPPSSLRRSIEAPAIVIGHPRDPVHPAADSAMLAEEMPNSRFVQAESILEWRLRSERLDTEAIEFVEHCFAGAPARRREQA